MRTYKQVAGFLLSPDWIADPALSEPYIQEMKEHGYRTIILFIRHMKQDVRSPQVHDAIKWITEATHRCGLRFVLDTEYLWWGMRFAEENPAACQALAKGYDAVAYDGEFEFDIAWPRTPGDGIAVFRELTVVFRDKQCVSPDLIEYDWQNQALPKPGANIRGRFKDGYSGPFVAFASVDVYTLVEPASDEYRKAQLDLLHQYADIPLDGIGWDEPGKGNGDPAYVRVTPAFLEYFQARNGYDLKEHLLRLSRLDNEPESVRVRHDYYSTLGDLTYEIQKAHYDQAKELYGPDIMLGTHHTWSSFVNDMTAGILDYFRLGNLLTAAWTDGSWWNELRYQTFYYLLADGLRLELGLRDAYYNDWTKQIPAVEEMRFASRYKKLFRTNWFNIFFSRFSECEVNFRHEPLRSRAIEDVAGLDAFDDFLGDDFMPESPVAMLYQWESMSVGPQWFCRLFYGAMANITHSLVNNGLFSTLMSPRSIARAKIRDGFIDIDGRKHSVLIAPYLYAPSRELWKRLKEIARAGVKVVLIGPLPEFTLEGDRILAEAAELIGIKPVSFNMFKDGFARRYPIPAPLAWENEWYDYIYPVSVTTGEAVHDAENRIVCVKSSKASLFYFPVVDPREDFAGLIAEFTPRAPFDYVAESAYVRLFSAPGRPDEQIMLAVAHGHRPDTPLVPDRYANKARPPRQYQELRVWAKLPIGTLEISGGTWQAVMIKNGIATASLGDCTKVEFNGTNV